MADKIMKYVVSVWNLDPAVQRGIAKCEPPMTYTLDGDWIPPQEDEWNDWTVGICDKPCGGGKRTDTRDCNGLNCVGDDVRVSDCNTEPCEPVEPVYSEWFEDQECDRRCGTGKRTLIRFCISGCVGDERRDEECNTDPCPTTGPDWSDWTISEPCSKTCGGGVLLETRICFTGDCAGGSRRTETCNTEPCPVIPPIGQATSSYRPDGTGLLDASGSTDPDGSIVNYKWILIGGPPDGVSIVPSQGNNPKSEVYGLKPYQEYEFSLVVVDDDGEESVPVKTRLYLSPPQAKATSEYVPNSNGKATLDGSGSIDNGVVVDYKWNVPSGLVLNHPDSSSPFATVTGIQPGTDYTFNLLVRDDDGLVSEPVETNLRVEQPVAVPEVEYTGDGNGILKGGASFDPDGTIEAYQWNGPPGVTITPIGDGSSGSVSGIKPDITYQFSLQVKDNDGITSEPVTTSLLVQPPKAVASSSYTGNGNGKLSAEGSEDVDGSVVEYRWSGPPYATITPRSGKTPEVSGLKPDVRQEFTVVAIDNDGLESAPAKTTIYVQSPTAVATSEYIPGSDGKAVLDGSASSDPDGTIVSYEWRNVGPSGPVIMSRGPGNPLGDVSGLEPGVKYVFELVTTDNEGLKSSPATTTIKVESPKAVATGEYIPGSNGRARFDGQGSSDDRQIVSYEWRNIGTPGLVIEDPTSAVTDVSNVEPGVPYKVELLVTDDDGLTSTTQFDLKVERPVAVADADFIGDGEGTLSAEDSFDPDGNVVSYEWSGPDGVQIIPNGNGRTGTVRGVTEGTYEFSLVVTDDDGLKSEPVTVEMALNRPKAKATSSYTTNGEGFVDGSQSHDIEKDGEIVRYIWSNPDLTFTPLGDGSPIAAVSGIEPDVNYEITLVVEDKDGLQSLPAKTNIYVQPPTAVATSEYIPGSGGRAVLDGSASSDPDGTIVSYDWEYTGPPGVSISPRGNGAMGDVTGLQPDNTYVFTLVTTDNNDLKSNVATTEITLISPVADAQSEYAEGGKATLDATNSFDTDSNKGELMFEWTQVSGPRDALINPTGKSSSPIADVTGIQPDEEYVFQVEVTDKHGLTSTDTTSVKVSKPMAIATGEYDDGVGKLNGEASYDDDNNIIRYKWSSPEGYQITQSDPSDPNAVVDIPVASKRMFYMSVTDDTGLQSDTVEVELAGPPSAIIGVEKDPDTPNKVTLDGTESKLPPGNNNAQYKWEVVSSPPGAPKGQFDNAFSPKPELSNLVEGNYVVQLTVTDPDTGLTAVDTTEIRVAKTTDPVAVAEGQYIKDGKGMLSGIKSYDEDKDGRIVKYTWSVASGDGTEDVRVFETKALGVAEVYGIKPATTAQFTLVVEDNTGALSQEAKTEISGPPIAKAVPSFETGVPVIDASNSLLPPGHTGLYRIEQLDGPTTANIADPQSPVTEVENLVPGVYSFRVTVTDEQTGLVDWTTVQITVSRDGGWSEWVVGDCSVTCGGGSRTNTRQCNN
ncbi:unnamed protein product, partial [Owenia fusiformis]